MSTSLVLFNKSGLPPSRCGAVAAFAGVALGVVACLARTPLASAASARGDRLYQAFRSTCVEAFVKSNGAAGEDAGREICGCAADESRHQGVTRKALKRETARIRKDPAYQIQDKRLLASFQYCTILSMEAADRERHEQEERARKQPPPPPRPGNG